MEDLTEQVVEMNNLGGRVGVFLDDVYIPDEVPPYIDVWVTVNSSEKFKEYITNYYNTNKKLPDIISFDGCLDTEQEMYMAKKIIGPILYSRFKKDTGLSCAKWLTEFCKQNEIKAEGVRISVHEPFIQMNSDIIFWFIEGQKDFNPVPFEYNWKKKTI